MRRQNVMKLYHRLQLTPRRILEPEWSFRVVSNLDKGGGFFIFSQNSLQMWAALEGGGTRGKAVLRQQVINRDCHSCNLSAVNTPKTGRACFPSEGRIQPANPTFTTLLQISPHIYVIFIWQPTCYCFTAFYYSINDVMTMKKKEEEGEEDKKNKEEQHEEEKRRQRSGKRGRGRKQQ